MNPEINNYGNNTFFSKNLDLTRGNSLKVAALCPSRVASYSSKASAFLLGAVMTFSWTQPASFNPVEQPSLRQLIDSSQNTRFSGRVKLANEAEVQFMYPSLLTIKTVSNQKIIRESVSNKDGIGYNEGEYLVNGYITSSNTGTWTEAIDPMKNKGRHVTTKLSTTIICPIRHAGEFHRKERVSLLQQDNERSIISSPYRSERKVFSTVVFAGPLPRKPLS